MNVNIDIMARSSASGRGRGGGRGSGRDSTSADSFAPQQFDSMCNGPLDRWKDVPIEGRERLDIFNGSSLGMPKFIDVGNNAMLGSLEKKLGRDISWEEMWRQSHCKKGKRPLDKLSEVGSPIINDLDLEEDVQQHRNEWVDERSYDTFEIYKGYLVEKYGEDDSQYPRFNEPLWSRASQATGGKNKGKLYGLRNISDPFGFITGTQTTSCNSSFCGHKIQDSEESEKAEKEKESEKAEKEKENTEKEAMLERMMSIESLLRVVTKNLPSSS
ncbi:hypothetical protein R6Q59_001811 [Mikania micrantha]